MLCARAAHVASAMAAAAASNAEFRFTIKTPRHQAEDRTIESSRGGEKRCCRQPVLPPHAGSGETTAWWLGVLVVKSIRAGSTRGDRREDGDLCSRARRLAYRRAARRRGQADARSGPPGALPDA